MEILDAAIKILENTYKKNIEILDSQDEDLIEKNKDFTKLYQQYYISNERLRNVLETLETLKNQL